MRSFITAVILLAAVFAGVFANIGFMEKYCGELISLSYTLPEDEEKYGDGGENLKKLGRMWRENKEFISFFMDFREVDRADSALRAMENSFYSKDHQQYVIYLDEFRHAVTRLYEINGITLENIF